MRNLLARLAVTSGRTTRQITGWVIARFRKIAAWLDSGWFRVVLMTIFVGATVALAFDSVLQPPWLEIAGNTQYLIPSPANWWWAGMYLLTFLLVIITVARSNVAAPVPVAVGIASVTALVLGATHYWSCAPDQVGFITTITYSVGLFVGEFAESLVGPTAQVCTGPLPLGLQIARMLALTSTFGVAATVMIAAFRRRLVLYGTRWVNAIEIVVGDKPDAYEFAVGLAAATGTRQSRRRVLLVRSEQESSWLGVHPRRLAIVRPSDMTRSLRKILGIGARFRATSVRALVVMEGDARQSLKAAFEERRAVAQLGGVVERCFVEVDNHADMKRLLVNQFNRGVFEYDPIWAEGATAARLAKIAKESGRECIAISDGAGDSDLVVALAHEFWWRSWAYSFPFEMRVATEGSAAVDVVGLIEESLPAYKCERPERGTRRARPYANSRPRYSATSTPANSLNTTVIVTPGVSSREQRRLRQLPRTEAGLLLTPGDAKNPGLLRLSDAIGLDRPSYLEEVGSAARYRVAFAGDLRGVGGLADRLRDEDDANDYSWINTRTLQQLVSEVDRQRWTWCMAGATEPAFTPGRERLCPAAEISDGHLRQLLARLYMRGIGLRPGAGYRYQGVGDRSEEVVAAWERGDDEVLIIRPDGGEQTIGIGELEENYVLAEQVL